MFAELVRALRRRSGLTQEELAERAGVSVRSIGNIELGRITAPQPATVRLLADAFGLAGAERDRFVQAVAGRAGDRAVVDRSMSAPAPAQLPPDVHAFTGRDEHLTRLDALLGSHGPTAVIISAVSGTAGVGKTALAVHWAHRVADRFPDGQLYVNLRGFASAGTPVDPATAVRDLLDALGVPAQRIPASVDAQYGLYRSTVAGRRILIVLDNARDAEQVRPLLPGSPTVLVVVTSRNKLTPLVAAEAAHPVNLDLLIDAEARLLLARRLGADRVAAEPQAVDAIIAGCARLPLALTIAAARARQTGFPLATLAAELTDAGRRLDALDAGDPASQVRAVFSWSYNALTPPAARLFRLLALHRGPDISVAAAASLAGQPPAQARRLLADLVRASLLTEHTPGRYTFHDLLRAYATELTHRHEPMPARQAALTRLLDHYTHTAHAADRLLQPHRDPIDLPLAEPATGTQPEELADPEQAMSWLDAERSVLLAVLRYTADHRLDTRTWQLAWTLDTFLRRRGHWLHLAEAWQAALPAAMRLDDSAAQTRARRLLAHAEIQLGRYDNAQAHLERTLDLQRQAGDLIGQAATHSNLVVLYDRQGRIEQGLDHARQALALSKMVGHQLGQAVNLNELGWFQTANGHPVEGLAYCEEALALFQQLGDREGEANTWDSLGYIRHQLGHHSEAINCYQHALALFSDLAERYQQAVTLTHLGDTLHCAGQRAAARKTWQGALNILTELDHPDADAVQSKLDTLDRQPAR